MPEGWELPRASVEYLKERVVTCRRVGRSEPHPGELRLSFMLPEEGAGTWSSVCAVIDAAVQAAIMEEH